MLKLSGRAVAKPHACFLTRKSIQALSGRNGDRPECGGGRRTALECLGAKNDLAVASCVVIKVEDTGPGIDRAQSENIFEPFFTIKPNGMGLGLSICRSIVESHGGHLTAVSDPKHGSIFRIDLPKYGSSAYDT